MHITTFTGRQFKPLAPLAEDVDIIDIAHSLSLQVRFTGHTRLPMTIAEHSWRVSLACHPHDALWGLLHDASEAYLVDLPRPIKHHPAMAVFRDIEASVQGVICDRYGLPRDEPASVKAADEMILGIEARDLLNTNGDPGWDRWISPVSGSRVDLRAPLPHSSAEALFLARFEELAK